MPWNFVCCDLHSSPYHLVIVPSNRLRSNCKLYTHSFCVWQGGSRYFCVRWGLPHWLAHPRWPPWNLQQRPRPHRGGAASPRTVKRPPRPGHATSPHRGANWKPQIQKNKTMSTSYWIQCKKQEFWNRLNTFLLRLSYFFTQIGLTCLFPVSFYS